MLWCNYTYESTEEARQATVARQRALPPLSFDMALSQYLSGILSISPFMTPFFYLLLLSTDVAGPRRVEAEFELQQCLHTSWGGGLLVNSLLFGGRKIVASSQADVQITKAGCTVPFNNGRANTIFAILLFNSQFGEKIMDGGAPAICERMPEETVDRHVESRPEAAALKLNACAYIRCQRFCFRMCELRKCEHSNRHCWRDQWRDAKVRGLFVAGRKIARQIF